MFSRRAGQTIRTKVNTIDIMGIEVTKQTDMIRFSYVYDISQLHRNYLNDISEKFFPTSIVIRAWVALTDRSV